MADTLFLADTHAHLQVNEYERDRAAVLARARQAGITRILTVGIDLADSRRALELAAAEPGIFAAAGVHPHEVAACDPHQLAEELPELLAHPSCRALGESGLDYHYDHSPRPRQREFFARQLALAAAAGLPVVVHVRDGDREKRDAFRDALAILDEIGGRVVFHCFSGGPNELEQVLVRGGLVSLTGLVTFGHARGRNRAVCELLPRIPAGRLMLETDCPWMAPEPWRGRRNEPAWLKHSAEIVAAILGRDLATLAVETSQTAASFFGWEADR